MNTNFDVHITNETPKTISAVARRVAVSRSNDDRVLRGEGRACEHPEDERSEEDVRIAPCLDDRRVIVEETQHDGVNEGAGEDFLEQDLLRGEGARFVDPCTVCGALRPQQ
jgi:hypothetical protein